MKDLNYYASKFEKLINENKKLKLENKALKQQLSLYGVVKSFYCLNAGVFGGNRKCSKQCLSCQKNIPPK